MPPPAAELVVENDAIFRDVLRLLDPAVVARFRAEAASVAQWLRADAVERVVALEELDGFLSREAGMPAAEEVRLVPESRGSFDPVTWSVDLPVAETDPDGLALALLGQAAHRERVFLMWRRMAPQAPTPLDLARLVGTENRRAAELAFAGWVDRGVAGADRGRGLVATVAGCSSANGGGPVGCGDGP